MAENQFEHYHEAGNKITRFFKFHTSSSVPSGGRYETIGVFNRLMLVYQINDIGIYYLLGIWNQNKQT